jgi:hypothetical protein
MVYQATVNILNLTTIKLSAKWNLKNVFVLSPLLMFYLLFEIFDNLNGSTEKSVFEIQWDIFMYLKLWRKLSRSHRCRKKNPKWELMSNALLYNQHKNLFNWECKNFPFCSCVLLLKGPMLSMFTDENL